MITAGIDCGAKTTKVVIMRDGKIIGRGATSTGFDQTEAIEASFEMALAEAGIAREQVGRVGGTGVGSNSIACADVTCTEIRAAATAAHYFFPGAATVADVGAEACRVAKLAVGGTIQDFAVNEKCAAGAGAFIEAMARALETPLEQIGDLALSSARSIPINAQCVIFAESEVVGLIHSKTPAPDIAKAILDAMAGRIASMIRRVGANPEIVVMGGVTRNSAIIRAIETELRIKGVLVPDNPEFGAAVGAAVAASQHGVE